MAATQQEKIMKSVAQAYLDTYGTSVGSDLVLGSGNIISIVAPNRFGPGYIRLIYPDTNEVWSADLDKNQKACRMHGEIIDPITGDRKQIQ